MKILFIHADYLNYRVREKAKFAEEIEPENRAGEMRDPLIAFICVEKVDELVNGPVEKAVSEIQDIASRVKVKNIVIFPFAHLSCELGSPTFAIQLLAGIEAKLKGDGYRVLRVPFGWYNMFELKSKGHPLAVLSRTVPRSTKADPAAFLL